MRRRLLLSVPLLFGLTACEMGTMGSSAAPQTFPIFFSADSARLGENAQAIVASAANAARANLQARVLVRGFAAPDTGSAEFNRTLSEARAQAVADGLVAAGVPQARIKMESRGAVPFELLPTESRRVEIQVGG